MNGCLLCLFSIEGAKIINYHHSTNIFCRFVINEGHKKRMTNRFVCHSPLLLMIRNRILLHNDLFAIDDVDTLSGIADALASYVVDVAFDSLILTSYTGYVSIIAVVFPYDV